MFATESSVTLSILNSIAVPITLHGSDLVLPMSATWFLYVFAHAIINTFLLLYFSGFGGYSGCSYCTVQGEYSKPLSKMVCLHHRSFLPNTDILRLNQRDFPSSKCTDIKPKTQAFVERANGEISAASTAIAKKMASKGTGCKGPYSLRRLPHHGRHLNTPIEPMHLLKNACGIAFWQKRFSQIEEQ